MEAAKDVITNGEGILGKLLAPGSLHIQNALDFCQSEEALNENPIVEGLLYKEEFLLCSATAKTGKTFLALELAKCVVTGQSFLGEFKTVKGKVLYFETELKPNKLRKRMIKMGIYSPENSDLKNLLICKKALKIDSNEGALELIKAITDHAPDLIILDPFYRLHSRNEDRAQEITPVLSWLKEIAQFYKVAFFVLHHEGKKGESNGNQTSHRPRGSSAFADVPDVIISMGRDTDKKSCRLSIENRNYQGSQLLIKLREDCSGWDLISSSNESNEEIDLEAVFQKVLIEPLSNTELLKKLQIETSLSERSCERKIAAALKLKYIEKTKIQGVVVYDLVKPTSVTSYEMADDGAGVS